VCGGGIGGGEENSAVIGSRSEKYCLFLTTVSLGLVIAGELQSL